MKELPQSVVIIPNKDHIYSGVLYQVNKPRKNSSSGHRLSVLFLCGYSTQAQLINFDVPRGIGGTNYSGQALQRLMS